MTQASITHRHDKLARKRLSAIRTPGRFLLALAFAAVGLSGLLAPLHAQQPATVSPELTARLEAEKKARRDCKIEICKAIAAPTTGAPIACTITKTWLKDEIVGRLVGGSYVWRYGHVQCDATLNLGRDDLAKLRSGTNDKIKFQDHKLACNVDSANPAEGKAFSVNLTTAIVTQLANGAVKSVSFEGLKTDGSTIASAAVTSVLAVDAVSGVVSRAAAQEIDGFIYTKCAGDGVSIPRK